MKKIIIIEHPYDCPFVSGGFCDKVQGQECNEALGEFSENCPLDDAIEEK